MKLMTDELRKRVPKLYATENLGADTVIQAKFFTPDSSWTWYVTEFDGEDTFFGIVSGHEVEMGYFSLSELESIRGPLGLKIERDLYFEPVSLRDFRRTSDPEVYSFIHRMYDIPEKPKVLSPVHNYSPKPSPEEKTDGDVVDFLEMFEEAIKNI